MNIIRFTGKCNLGFDPWAAQPVIGGSSLKGGILLMDCRRAASLTKRFTPYDRINTITLSMAGGHLTIRFTGSYQTLALNFHKFYLDSVLWMGVI